MLTGALVRLTIGGPLMTVWDASDYHAQCVWFEGATLRKDVFEVAELLMMEDGDLPTHWKDGQHCRLRSGSEILLIKGKAAHGYLCEVAGTGELVDLRPAMLMRAF